MKTETPSLIFSEWADTPGHDVIMESVKPLKKS